MTYRQLVKDLSGDEWTLGNMTGLATEEFWNWEKTDTTGYDGNLYLAIDECIYFERELWFESGNCICRKHRSVYQDHTKYIHNYIVKPVKVKILRYTERMCEIHDIEKYLPQPLMKVESDMEANWIVRNKYFAISDIQLAIKDGFPKSMRFELEDHPEDHRSLTYEDWYDLLSKIDVKDERKRAAVHINNISSARSASLSYIDDSMRIPRRKKAKYWCLKI